MHKELITKGTGNNQYCILCQQPQESPEFDSGMGEELNVKN